MVYTLAMCKDFHPGVVLKYLLTTVEKTREAVGA
jgi:hypothetical protein